jgi:two-component system sensor kinase FixL
VRGVSLDVTERKQSEERLRMVVEASSSAMIMVNPLGNMTLVNGRTELVFGYPREELIGEPIEILVPEHIRADHPGYRRGYSTEPTTRAMGAGRELFGRRKDGSLVPVEIGLDPIRTAEGLFVLASIIDITERRRSEHEKEQLRRELAHAGRVTMLGQLASSLAHELGQPLGAILRNAETAELLLQSDSPDLEELRAIVTDIRNDDHRAGDVIDRLRTLLKRRTLDARTIAVDQLTGDVVALAGFDATTRRIRLATNVPPGLPLVRGDRVHLQQVLLNLIMNGMDAVSSGSGGTREVTLDARRNEAGMVEIAVRDSGHGVPPEKLEKLFEAFFTTKPNGMGMGLSISRTIVEAHGGHIWVENNADRGATFRFTLAAAEPDAQGIR